MIKRNHSRWPVALEVGTTELCSQIVVSLTNIIRLIKVRGRSRLVLTLAERMGANGQILVCDAQHNVYILPANVSQSWSLAATGRYDTAECRLIEWFAQPDSTVLDIGASLGLYSVPLASCAQKGSFHVPPSSSRPRTFRAMRGDAVLCCGASL